MNKTKKVWAIALAICIAGCFATTSYAETETDMAQLTLVDPVLDRATLTVDLSPGVRISVGTAPNAYNIITKNINTNTNARIEYGINNAFAGYYQNQDATDPTSINGTDLQTEAAADTNPFAAAWTAITGGT